MIRINLLPVRAAKKQEQGRIQLAIGVLVLIAGLAGNYLWYQSADKAYESARNQVRSTKQQISQLEKIIGEVKDIQKKKEDLQKKLQVIAKLHKKKTGPVKMMDSLATVIPKEVWIDKFAEKGGHFTMVGHALSHEDLATFLTALKGSPFFKGVQLKGAKLVTNAKNQQAVVTFTLTGQADYAA